METVFTEVFSIKLAEAESAALSAENVFPELFPFSGPSGAERNITNISEWGKKPVHAGTYGSIRTSGAHFITDAGRIRFWGTNLCFSANFPDKESAEKLAARLARFGFNCVRLHHMDSHDIWGNSWGNQRRGVSELDSDQLDRLDYLIYQLKKHGIYVNINLHVSRQFTEKEGFPHDDLRPKYDKGLDNFEPRMIEFQKKYARDLLTHVNPYTKLAYTEDPCVALVEINNENSVVASWFWGQLDTLPSPYRDTLNSLWNNWLKKKYSSTEAVRQAWESQIFPLEEEQINYKTQDGVLKSPWSWNKGNSGISSAEIKHGTIHLMINKMGDVEWLPQLLYYNLTVRKGVPYTLTFRIKAAGTGSVNVNVSENHPEWKSLGLNVNVDVSSDWKTVKLCFIARGDDQKARICFSGFQPGTYELSHFSFRAGGDVGLSHEYSLENGNIPAIKFKSSSTLNTPAAFRDMSDFLIDLETHYWSDMYHFLKDELKIHAMISGTQLRYGSWYAQAQLDYFDIHAYWHHPAFPGRAWDMKNWYIGTDALVNKIHTPNATLPVMALSRVIGSPFTVSEYNHPFPTPYAAEGFLMLCGMAAAQDWAGVFPFTWSHSTNHEPDHIGGFFDLCGNPAQLVHFPACWALFCRGDVSVFPSESESVVNLGKAQERALFAVMQDGYSRTIKELRDRQEKSLSFYSGVRLTDMPESSEAIIPKSSPEAVPEIKWNTDNPTAGYFTADTAGCKVFTGFTPDDVLNFGEVKMKIGKTRMNWSTVTITRTNRDLSEKGYFGKDDKNNHQNVPDKMNHGFCSSGAKLLIAATGVMRNSDMKEYTRGKNNISVDNFGKAPVLCEGVPVTLTLHCLPEKIEAYALNDRGERTQRVIVEKSDEGCSRLELSAKYKTLWYEVIIH